MSRAGVTSGVRRRTGAAGSRFTLRGLSDTALKLLNDEARRRGLSLNRYMLLVLEERAEIGHRRAQLELLRRRLDVASDRLAVELAKAGRPVSDSAALLWAARGDR
jgi:hypothetical protein